SGRDRRTPQARTRRTARLPARGHGAPGRSGWREGRLPHQRGGRSDAMASGGGGRAHLRSVAGTAAAEHAGAVSVPHSWLPFRQRAKCKNYFSAQAHGRFKLAWGESFDGLSGFKRTSEQSSTNKGTPLTIMNTRSVRQSAQS